MNPTRLKGLTPDEFERLCLELAQKSLKLESAFRRGVDFQIIWTDKT